MNSDMLMSHQLKPKKHAIAPQLIPNIIHDPMMAACQNDSKRPSLTDALHKTPSTFGCLACCRRLLPRKSRQIY